MNAIRPVRMQPERAFTMDWWRVGNSGQAYPIDAETLDQALLHCQHKDTLFSLLTNDGSNTSCLSIYVIQQGQAKYVRNPETGLSERVTPLKEKLIASLRVDAFEPTRPFDAFRDAAHGRDLTLVEG